MGVFGNSGVEYLAFVTTVWNFRSLTNVAMSVMVFLNATPCSFLDRFQHFGGAGCILLQGGRREGKREMEARRSSGKLIPIY
jgi:hypothetical protein